MRKKCTLYTCNYDITNIFYIICSLVIAVIQNTTGCETYLKFLELTVFNFNKIYLATIKLKSNREIG